MGFKDDDFWTISVEFLGLRLGLHGMFGAVIAAIFTSENLSPTVRMPRGCAQNTRHNFES